MYDMPSYTVQWTFYNRECNERKPEEKEKKTIYRLVMLK